MEKIVLTDEQKKEVKPCVEAVLDAQTGYNAACRLMRETDKKMWAMLRKMYPDIDPSCACVFHHPEDGDWYVQ